MVVDLSKVCADKRKRTPHMCITCKNYEPYHCTLDDSYIGYLYCAEPTNCKGWRLSDDYKKGGKFYQGSTGKNRALTRQVAEM